MSQVDVSLPRDYMNPYAGFWRRVWACLIDALLLLVPAVLIFVLFDPEYLETEALEGPRFLAAFLIGMTYWLYFAVLESSTWQASLGKRALGIVVVDMAGRRVSWETASFRAWPLFLPAVASGINLTFESIVAIAGLVSCFAVAFTERKQGLHDKTAGCLVVRKGAQFSVDQAAVKK